MNKLILVLLFILFSNNIFSDNLPYYKKLLKIATQKKLHEKRMWHILLHYNDGVLSKFKSEADGKSFFLSKTGRRSPKDELKATLKSFFDPNIEETKNRQHPQCQFPARFEWLVKELNIDTKKLPNPKCERFNTWKKQINPSSITLIFSSAYLNNPASMYGHTFLRIDRKGMEKFPLLSYAVNFSATPTTRNPLFYSIQGIFGGFRGTFSTLPYYLKVKEYSSMENRDLWEYKLNISPQRVNFMVKHLWELGSTYFDYYYLDENCSYHILSLIEVANPKFNFRKLLHGYTVIPSETIKTLYTQKNLVSKVICRPSLLNKLKNLKSMLKNNEINIVKDIVDSNGKKINLLNKIKGNSRKALILESAMTLNDYKNSSDNKKNKYKKIKKIIQLKRSKLRVKTPSKAIKTPFNPKDAHRGGFMQIAGGIENSKFITRYLVRTSLNDMLSDHAGYIPASEIQLSSFSFIAKISKKTSYPYIKSKILPDTFNIVKITSITPIEAWIRKPSWRLWFGATTPKELKEYNWSDLYYGLKGGPGVSFKSNLINKEFYYIFLDSEAVTGLNLNHNYRIGFGASIGIYLEFMENFNFQTEFSYLYHVLGDKRTGNKNYQITMALAYTIKQSVEFRLEGKRIKDSFNELIFSIGAYF